MRFTSETGRLHGAARTPAKVTAARRNGRRGGRPPVSEDWLDERKPNEAVARWAVDRGYTSRRYFYYWQAIQRGWPPLAEAVNDGRLTVYAATAWERRADEHAMAWLLSPEGAPRLISELSSEGAPRTDGGG